jgi:hypothetical protein
VLPLRPLDAELDRVFDGVLLRVPDAVLLRVPDAVLLRVPDVVLLRVPEEVRFRVPDDVPPRLEVLRPLAVLPLAVRLPVRLVREALREVPAVLRPRALPA